MNGSFLLDKNFAVPAAYAIAAAALVFFLLRAFSLRKLRLPRTAKPRPARLGIVDVFDVGPRRQLVIVRRDNVEHLLMIGGPNDVVIESQFMRADNREPRFSRDSKPREKELRGEELQKSPEAVPSMPDVAGSPLPLSARVKGARSGAYAFPAASQEATAQEEVPPFLSAIRSAAASRGGREGVKGPRPSSPSEFASFDDLEMLGDTPSNPTERTRRSAAPWLRPPARGRAAEASVQARPLEGSDSELLPRSGPEQGPVPSAAALQAASGAAAAAGERPAAAPPPDGRPHASGFSLEEELSRSLGRARGQANKPQ